MSNRSNKARGFGLSNILLPKNSRMRTRPIWFASPGNLAEDLEPLGREARAWLHATGWKPSAGSCALLPSKEGDIAGAVLGLGAKSSGENRSFLVGELPRLLPHGAYHLETMPADPDLACVAWLMGSYQFARYSKNHARSPRHLKLPDGVDEAIVMRIANGMALGRDLINIPANDLGPAELADTAVHLAESHGAECLVTVGNDLLEQGFPMIHAVGRASDRAPRLIDLTWGDLSDPKVTIVGKGVCFDTGGLNIKPGNSMSLMKKDMGGAASALALATMVMGAALRVRLRVLIPAADNNISANSFRPGDVLKSRKGRMVDIENTDAEGRLVLADALALADEEKPDILINFATLTGSARVALGADLPPFFTDDDKLAGDIASCSEKVSDPLWRLPLWRPYEAMLAGKVGDVCHLSEGSFAGSITAALFLKRFVTRTKRFVHMDIYGWVPKNKPARPKGGEPQGARAIFELLRRRYG